MTELKIRDIIKISPGFSTSVDIETDLDDNAKVAGYIPTEAASDIILDMAENLRVDATRRARLITGTYGTGKSHLALVLARLYSDGLEANYLKPVSQKLESKWPGKIAKLNDERTRLSGKFLLVLLTGDRWGTFDDSLLVRLDEALAKEGLSDILPETAFTAARNRIKEIKREHKATYEMLKETVKLFNFESVDVLDQQLKQMKSEAYQQFCDIHKKVCSGAAFSSHHQMNPAEVYSAVARRLVEDKGYAGICVIWDEFGRYMERVVDDPTGLEGQHIQEFAKKGCNNSHVHQVHLYLVCHRSLQEYVSLNALNRASGLSKSEQEEWTKISGRFREFNMKSTDHEVYQLMDQILLQEQEDVNWKSFCNLQKDYFDEITDTAYRLKLFPEFRRDEIHNIVTLGIYPLHPMSSFCLPKISQRVAQNERTMFLFLSNSGSDTIGPFVNETSIINSKNQPTLLSADKLWDFFLRNVEGHLEYRRVATKLRQIDTQIEADDVLGKRIIKSVALLSVIQSDRAPCTENILRLCMGLDSLEATTLREKLKSFCGSEAGRSKILHQNVADGTYRFATTGIGDLLEEKIESTVSERVNIVGVAEHLRSIWTKLSLAPDIPATGYSDDYMLDRSFGLSAVDFVDLRNVEKFLTNLNSGDFIDGKAMIILCESTEEIAQAKVIASTGLKHKQILLGIPREPLKISTLLRNHETIIHLENVQANLYGPGADLRDEWEQQESDHREAISQRIMPILDPQKQLINWYSNGTPLKEIRSVSRLREAVSEIMRDVFPSTPRISHEKSVSDVGTDSAKRARRNIIDKLLLPEGPTLVAKETNAQEKTIIKAFYHDNHILKVLEGGTYEIVQPSQDLNEPIYAIWNEIETLIETAKQTPIEMSEVINKLRRSPYGLKLRSISLLLAAILRRYIQRGNISFEFRKSGTITKITGDVLDDAVLENDKYRLIFTDIGEKQDAIILGVALALRLGINSNGDKGELLEEIKAEVTRWWRGLSSFSRETKELDNNCILFREQILRPLARDDGDVRVILLETLAEMLQPITGKDTIVKEAVSDLFGSIKNSLDTAVEKILLPNIGGIVQEVFSSPDLHTQSGIESLKSWFDSLPLERRNTRIAGHALVLCKVAREVSIYRETEEPALITRLSKDITGTLPDNWPDSMLERFRGMLEGAKKAIEEAEIKPIPDDSEEAIIISKPNHGQISLTIIGGGDGFQRTFVPVDEISQMGDNLRNIIRESIKGIGGALPSGECETILIEVLREVLK